MQLDEVESFFSEQNTYKKAKEIKLMIKSLAKNYNQLELKIKEMHNYEIPQIIKLDIDCGSMEYLQWVKAFSEVS